MRRKAHRKTEVWVNNIKVGEHTGGFTPFTFDVTEALEKSTNTLTVKVWDPTDKGFQPRGKQVSNPRGIWYTPVSGIWQTVWLEPVSEHYIAGIKTTPDIDTNKIKVKVETDSNRQSDRLEYKNWALLVFALLLVEILLRNTLLRNIP